MGRVGAWFNFGIITLKKKMCPEAERQQTTSKESRLKHPGDLPSPHRCACTDLNSVCYNPFASMDRCSAWRCLRVVLGSLAY